MNIPKSIARLFVIIFFCFYSHTIYSQVYVHGYYRKNGTYVQPHYRSNPDGNPYNNWSYPGNVNPYTGKVASGNPSTYLFHYYNGKLHNDGYVRTSTKSKILYSDFRGLEDVPLTNVCIKTTDSMKVVGKVLYQDKNLFKVVDQSWHVIGYVKTNNRRTRFVVYDDEMGRLTTSRSLKKHSGITDGKIIAGAAMFSILFFFTMFLVNHPL